MLYNCSIEQQKGGQSVNKQDNSFNMIQVSNKQRDSIPWESET
jgi:hypothetical protein